VLAASIGRPASAAGQPVADDPERLAASGAPGS
jgi:hypothetical protein